MVTVIIPLGGKGERFKKSGYMKPKALVRVMGKEIIFWLLDSLNLSLVDRVLIPYNAELDNYRFPDYVMQRYPSTTFSFLCMREQTEGAAHTLLLAANMLVEEGCRDGPVLCLDGDNFYTEDIVSSFVQMGCPNAVGCFDDTQSEPIYSYLTLDQAGNITDIVEKQKVSNIACSGAYGYGSWMDMRAMCEETMTLNLRMKGEFYTSCVIKHMIELGKPYLPLWVKVRNYHCLGTPLQVRIFCNNVPVVDALTHSRKRETLRICFDLDDTLVTHPTVPGDFSTVRPINSTIQLAQYLKKLGHIIIVNTARASKLSRATLNVDIARGILDNIQKFKIPCDELNMSKPHADIYVDSNSISSYSDLEKELGFYRSQIEPRSFNRLSERTMQVFRKQAAGGLQGEIYWYSHIPNSIKDMFPLFIGYGEDSTWYDIEKINGVPLSRYFLSGEMSSMLLDSVVSTLRRVHESLRYDPTEHETIDPYLNYASKVTHRYQNYDYSRFPDSERVYNALIAYVSEYQSASQARITPIHGDPVLTNILVNEFGKIKLIDMRGQLGDVFTIFGDVMYDWSKLYQSFIGYDEILEGKIVDQTYRNGLVAQVEQACAQALGGDAAKVIRNLRYITASLLFSLLPLHDNEKCLAYYQLIFKILPELAPRTI